MNRIDVDKYISAEILKVSLAFGDQLNIPSSGLVPYEAKDKYIKIKIDQFFDKYKRWNEITIDILKDSFGDDYWSLFHFIGWEGLYSLSPLMIKLTYEGYLTGDEILNTTESIFSRFPYETDDKNLSFLDWMGMFDDFQIMCILGMITFVYRDPLNKSYQAFGEGRRWWVRYYLDGKNNL